RALARRPQLHRASRRVEQPAVDIELGWRHHHRGLVAGEQQHATKARLAFRAQGVPGQLAPLALRPAVSGLREDAADRALGQAILGAALRALVAPAVIE